LLIPAGSRLLQLNEIHNFIGQFDPAALLYPWKHPDRRLDALAQRVQAIADACDKARHSSLSTFAQIWRAAATAIGAASYDSAWPVPRLKATPPVPRISEPWYCCAEPTEDQFVAIPSASAKLPAAATTASSAEGFL